MQQDLDSIDEKLRGWSVTGGWGGWYAEYPDWGVEVTADKFSELLAKIDEAGARQEQDS